MANQIERNVFVLQDSYKKPIDYVRFTNAIPIVFNFQDYDIPSSATATVFCAKPSGTAVYANAELLENAVTITVTDQMFIELGTTILQVKIENNGTTLVTFGWPVVVHENSTEGDIPPSQNESGFWDELQQQVDDAVENCNNAVDSVNQVIQESQQATQNANNAAANANEAAQQVFNQQYILTANQTFGLSDTVQPTAEGNALVESIEGDTWQQETKGYQLFDASKLPTASAGGATVTNNGDGSFSISGSGKLTESFNRYVNLPKEESLKLLKAGMLYGYSSEVTLPAVGFLICTNGKFTELNLMENSVKSVEITQDMLDADDFYVRLRFYGSSGLAIVPGTVKPMFYQDGDGTWEPFTGRQPAPSPEYPQHIYGIGDTGYFDGELRQGFYSTSGVFSNFGAGYVCSATKIPCVQNDNIKVLYDDTANIIRVNFYSADGLHISYQDFFETKIAEITAPENTAYCMIGINKKGITPQTAGHIAVTINGKYAVKVNTMSANLFDASNIPTTSDGGATVTNNGDGSFTVGGSGNLSSSFSVSYNLTPEETQKMFKSGVVYGLRNVGATLTNPYFMAVARSGSESQEMTEGFEITEEMLQDSSFYVSFDFYGSSGSAIKTGTIKPMLYQDGDGTFVPFQDETAYLPISYPLYKGDQIVKIGSEYKVRREKGYIQSYSSESIPGEYVSSTGELSSGATVVYQLATPVYEDIDQDQFYSIMAADELTNVSLLGENENLVPTNVIRFPRNEDGALSTTAYAVAKKYEDAYQGMTPSGIEDRLAALETKMAALNAQTIIVE